MHERIAQRVGRFALATLATAVTGVSAFGQGTFPIGEVGGVGYFLQQPPGASSVYERTVVGDLFDDGLADVFYIADSRVQGRFSPGLFDAPMTDVFGRDVNDFDIANDGGRDRAFAVGAEGLLSAHWDDEAYQWSVTTESVGSAWDGALYIRAVDRGGRRRPLLYGVMADGREVRSLMPVSGGFADRSVITLASDITSIEDLQFVAGGLPELAVLTDDGDGAIYSGTWVSNSGVPILAATNAGSTESESVVVGSLEGADTSWAAWMHGTSAAPASMLTVLDPSGGVSNLSLPGSTPGGIAFAAGAMVAGDFDGDGSVDLLFSNMVHSSLVALMNSGASGEAADFTWQAAEVRTLNVQNAPGPFGRDALFAVDLDNDGDEDFGLGIAAHETYLIVKNGNVAEDDMTPGILIRGPAFAGDLDPPEFSITGQYECSFVHDPAIDVPADATHLEIMLWMKGDAVTGLDPTILTARYLSINQTDITLQLADHVGTQAPVNAPILFSQIFLFSMRYVTYDAASDTVTEVFPGCIYALEGQTAPSVPLSANERWLQLQLPGRNGEVYNVHIAGGIMGGTNGGGMFATALRVILDGAASGGGTGSECLPCSKDEPPTSDGG